MKSINISIAVHVMKTACRHDHSQTPWNELQQQQDTNLFSQPYWINSGLSSKNFKVHYGNIKSKRSPNSIAERDITELSACRWRESQTRR